MIDSDHSREDQQKRLDKASDLAFYEWAILGSNQ
jgi:hypothetical protein